MGEVRVPFPGWCIISHSPEWRKGESENGQRWLYILHTVVRSIYSSIYPLLPQQHRCFIERRSSAGHKRTTSQTGRSQPSVPRRSTAVRHFLYGEFVGAFRVRSWCTVIPWKCHGSLNQSTMNASIMAMSWSVMQATQHTYEHRGRP